MFARRWWDGGVEGWRMELGWVERVDAIIARVGWI